MLEGIKALFGLKARLPYAQLVKEGATIVDVRTPEEYRQGHIQGSINIPLQHLKKSLPSIDPTKPVITCCLSGARSASAKKILEEHGFEQVYNGGGWTNLKMKI